MAKETPGQQRTVERVMHEFKHGELKQPGGRKVESRKQAVAIALREAGNSKFETRGENKRALKHTKEKERKAETGMDAKEGKGASRKITKAKATKRAAKRKS